MKPFIPNQLSSAPGFPTCLTLFLIEQSGTNWFELQPVHSIIRVKYDSDAAGVLSSLKN